MTLEIKVKETVTVFDISTFDAQYKSLEEIVGLVKKGYWEFLKSEDTTLEITIKKQGNNSPPTLGVHVSDVADIKEVMGG